MTPPAPYEKSKFLGSGGSMVARLKLKGIDGRAPPGVFIALAPKSRGRETRASGALTPANCNTVKLRGLPKAVGAKPGRKRPGGRG